VVEWHIEGPVEFDAVLCDQRLPDFAPTEPLCFPDRPEQLPSRLEDVFAFLRAGHKAFPIGRPVRPAAIARKIKTVIDRSYEEHRTLGSIASQLGVRPQFMTAVFKRDFGLSPSLYRARLRISDSIPLLVEGQMSVTAVAFEVGFGDLSRYQKQFRRATQVPPSSFRLRRENTTS
jgi:AraC-like DNA-binding protein